MKTTFRRQRIKHARAGLTLIEVLVVVCIVGMLAAIAIPAVNGARETGRRTSCTNNFRQFGAGLTAHEASLRKFPVGYGLASTHAALLPYLGYNDVHEYSGAEEIKKYAFNLQAIHFWKWGKNGSLLGRDRIPIFRCPSDPQDLTEVYDWPGNNIRVCCGVYDFNPYAAGVDLKAWTRRAGAFSNLDFTAADIQDGMSRTVAASEKLLGSRIGQGYSRQTDFWSTGLRSAIPHPDMNEMMKACESLASNSPPYVPESGATWIVPGFNCTLYNHAVGPNADFPDCTCIEPTVPANTSICPTHYMEEGIHRATSYHPGGVNVLFLDGHTEFVINDVDLAIWRAFATRAAAD